FQPFSRLREKVPGGRMRGRAQRAALALVRRQSQQRQDQGLSHRDGASHLSLPVQRNLAQRKHTPPSRPVRCTGSAEPAGFSERASKPARKTPPIHVRRPAGLVRRLRRSGGAPKAKAKAQAPTAANRRSGGSREISPLPLPLISWERLPPARFITPYAIPPFTPITCPVT